MSIKVESAGSGSFGDVGSWTVSETVTPAIASDAGGTIGDASLTVRRTGDTDLAGGNALTITHPTLGVTRAEVHTVTDASPAQATLMADSPLGRFLSGRMIVPGIESGTPAAALDVAMQASGTRRQIGPNAKDDYWSLAGHSVGFTATGDIIHPASTDLVLQNNQILVTATPGEKALYQEITGFCAISRFSTAGLPTTVLGDTIQLRERTYVKFTVAPTTAALTTTTFQVDFGPSFRQFGNSRVANGCMIRVSYNQNNSGGQLTTTIVMQDAAGVAQTATSTTERHASLLRTGPIVVSLGISQSSAGAVNLRARAQNADASVETTATSINVKPTRFRMYSKQFTITQPLSAGGIRDLVIRRGAADTWANFHGVAYVAPAGFVDETTSAHQGSPIAQHEGELWEYVKQVCVARGVELAATPAGITLREIGSRTLDITHRASASRTISQAVQARNIVVVNQNTKALVTPQDEAYRATTIYSIGVGETRTFDVRVPDGIRFLWSPRPWYYSKDVNGIVFNLAQYADGYAELEAGTVGRYFVTAQDGFPISPVAWTDFGGRVTVAMKDGKATLTITGPAQQIPGIPGPYRIGETDGSTAYAVLRLHGVGVTSDPVTVTLPSGAPHADTRVETTSPVNNVAIGNLGEVYDAAAWAATRVAGPNLTLNASIPINRLAGFGLTAGALITHRDNLYRVNTCQITGGVATISASRLARLSDSPGKTRTLAQYATAWAGATLRDHSIAPLALTAPTP
ncbi:hypothetical protein BKA24_001802 [Microbacterium marinum]|uniref:Minor tail protein n=1 Tax=Microbacterium marinum TaxID=421115 RepID=A0A7W7BQR2_9MICO|nr:hypothetical protein [Microbacterium marinum]MBB4667093.1 hypothetical protein [Microbacterium marinum]